MIVPDGTFPETWPVPSTDDGMEPDVVIASAGDVLLQYPVPEPVVSWKSNVGSAWSKVAWVADA